MLAMIVACSENNIIGMDGDLPWHLPDDLKHFMRSTRGCPVIMGRKTFESLNAPLPNRTNIVVSRTMRPETQGVVVVPSLQAAIDHAQELVNGSSTPIWIAGGGAIYKAAMPFAYQIVRTLIHAQIEGDVQFPTIDPQHWGLVRSEHHPVDDRHELGFTIQWFERQPLENLPV